MDTHVLYRSKELAPRDRISIWNDVVWRNYVPLSIQIAPHDNFVGRVALSQLGNVRIVTSGSRPQRISRTPKLIAQDDDDYLMLGLQLQGSSVIEQHDRQALLRRGDFVLWDTRRPYDIVFPNDWEMAVFQFPRDMFTLTNRAIDSITATTLMGRTGVTHIAAALLMSIANEARHHSFEHRASLLDHTLGLLSLCIDDQLISCNVPPAYDEVLFRRINNYISSSLADPELCVADIAGEHGLSVRQLYRIFKEYHCTVVDVIRRQRLERIKEDIISPRSRHITIAAIARKWGFLDIPHFNRVFKSHYKTTPRELRRQVTPNL
ncbi:AraC family transcriptional regulator [Pusillimonas sp. T2]|uniref:AraC-like ligand-binding domain-containing protein n=1 Tax=Pusillimonas sp. T2 TaxID=1548123 RepID=UPI000B9CD2A4|nr:helix-turn-helix domain-containing protein [Pusillimonas sp. T2]OXR48298.1 AraC family transcriptional regulator [Pusillimonas sp. T2]